MNETLRMASDKLGETFFLQDNALIGPESLRLSTGSE